MTDFSVSIGWQQEDKSWQEILELPEQIAQVKGNILLLILKKKVILPAETSTFQKVVGTIVEEGMGD